MALSEAQKAAMLEELRHSDIVSVARKYACSVSETRDLKLLLDAPQGEQMPEWGRGDIEKYAIARIRPGDSWPLSEAIAAAQREYDEGTVEIATGRVHTANGPWLILYRIPRKVPTVRAPYFSRNFNVG